MKSADFLSGILIGVLIGGALGLLFAPETGEQTRELVSEKARKLKDAATERGKELLHRAEKEIEE